LTVLEGLADIGREGATTVELSRRLGLHHTTVRRLIQALPRRDYAEQVAVSSRYRLGLRVLGLASATTVGLSLREVGMPPRMAHTDTDEAGFKAQLSEATRRGFALDNEVNRLGIRCAAAPIFNFEGRRAGAMRLSAPAMRADAAPAGASGTGHGRRTRTLAAGPVSGAMIAGPQRRMGQHRRGSFQAARLLAWSGRLDHTDASSNARI
jgi:DNA-binding IclR family transcriptional regulator